MTCSTNIAVIAFDRCCYHNWGTCLLRMNRHIVGTPQLIGFAYAIVVQRRTDASNRRRRSRNSPFSPQLIHGLFRCYVDCPGPTSFHSAISHIFTQMCVYVMGAITQGWLVTALRHLANVPRRPQQRKKRTQADTEIDRNLSSMVATFRNSVCLGSKRDVCAKDPRDAINVSLRRPLLSKRIITTQQTLYQRCSLRIG